MTTEEKRSARIEVTKAINKGTLIRQPCEVCGATEKIQAHHDDYSKPLDVRWLCYKDHLAVHKMIPGTPRVPAIREIAESLPSVQAKGKYWPIYHTPQEVAATLNVKALTVTVA